MQDEDEDDHEDDGVVRAFKKKKKQGKNKKTLPNTLLLKFKHFRQGKGKKKPKEKKEWEGPEQTSLARDELTVRPYLKPARAALCCLAPRRAPPPAPPRPAARPAPPRPAPAHAWTHGRTHSAPTPHRRTHSPMFQEHAGLEPFKEVMLKSLNDLGVEELDVAEIGTLDSGSTTIPLRSDTAANDLLESLDVLNSVKKLPLFYIILKVSPP